MPIDSPYRVLPFFQISHVPQLTALAASVYATMMFPGDEEELDRLAYAQVICLDWRARYINDGTGAKDSLPVVRWELATVLDFTKRVSFEKLTSLTNEAYSSVNILKFALLLDLDSETTSSIGKAVALTMKYVAVEKRTLMSRWARFKGVAHLWAAYSDFCWTFQQVEPEWKSAAWISFMKDPRPVLTIANSYRDWGVHHAPKRAKSVPTLNSELTWSIRNDIDLPQATHFNREQLYIGLTEEGRELLKTYRRK